MFCPRGGGCAIVKDAENQEKNSHLQPSQNSCAVTPHQPPPACHSAPRLFTVKVTESGAIKNDSSRNLVTASVSSSCASPGIERPFERETVALASPVLTIHTIIAHSTATAQCLQPALIFRLLPDRF